MRYKVEKHTPSACGWCLKAYLDSDTGQEKIHVKKKDWPAGFNESLTFQQAKEVEKTYNAQHKLMHEELKRVRIVKRHSKKKQIESAWLPENIVAEFEKTFINDLTGKKLANAKSRFYIVQKLIADLNTKPSFWEMNPPKIYKWCQQRKLSLDYTQRIITTLNRYGRFYSVSLGFPFGDVPWPTGAWQTRINDDFFEEHPDGMKSLKLEDSQLPDLKKKLTEENYNWVLITRWFGLRPEEADLLLTPVDAKGRKNWWLDENTLHIDQPKLRAIAKRNRYKHIPVNYNEQQQVLSIIQAGKLKRPSRRTIESRFPEGVTLYGGRHAFASYIDAKGTPLDTIRSWLGHQNISTTEKYYRDRNLIKGSKKKI